MKLKPELVTLKKEQRLYQIEKPLIGLTGGIATGKSSVTQILKDKGFSVIDADELVREIYDQRKTFEFISTNFPEAVSDNQIQKPKLREIFFQDPSAKKQIEEFIYSKLPQIFLEKANNYPDSKFLIYDVPLLFEKNMQDKFDFTVLVYSSPHTQIDRVVKRDQISKSLAEDILKQQFPIDQKRTRVDYVIENDEDSKTYLIEQTASFLESILIDS